jgi:multiple sugar transport system substrate-binding protein
MTASAFAAAVALAAVVALPDLFEGFLRSRPVGRGSVLAGAPSVEPLDPGIIKNARGAVTLCTGRANIAAQIRAVDDFNDTFGPDLHARIVQLSANADQQYRQFSRLQRARSGACDVYYSDVVWTADLAHRGWLEDLSRYLDRRGPVFVPAMLDTVTFDGRQWGVPKHADAGLLFYRRDRIGAPPKTWQGLYRTSRAQGTNRFRYQALDYEGLTVNFLEVAYAAGAQDIVTADAKANINQPAAVAALQFMVDGIRGRVAPRTVVLQTEHESLSAFGHGRADFMRNWPFAYATLHDSKAGPTLAGRVGVAPLPRWGNRPPASVLGGQNLVISRFSKHPAAALKLIDHLSGTTVIRRDAIDYSLVPVLVDLWKDPAVQAAIPAFPELEKAIRTAKARPAVPNYEDVSRAISTNVNRALRGAASPAEALYRANDEMQQALDVAYGRSPG